MLGSEFGDELIGFFAGLLLAEQHPRARLDEHPNRRPPDAPRTAGDQGNLARE